jgi:hypothetical protein
MRHRFCTTLSFALATAFFSQSLIADEALTFEKHIRPIFRAHCFDCHGAVRKLEGGLDLRLVRFIEKGGETGPAVVKGQPDESFIMQRIRDGEMPPGNHRVPDDEIETLAAWIRQGAKTAKPEPESIGPGLGLSDEERAYWFFQPIIRPHEPTVGAIDRSRTPIDAFLLAEMEPRNLSFAADADKATLIRRAYMDLIGIPPTPQQVEAFAKDNNSNAWTTVIDGLLDSPHYGERWGRHWLDVAGYADSEGNLNRDDVRPWAYKYRDWVIRAINNDLPFDQFITWQLAGDELVEQPHKNMSPEQIDKLVATGFLRMAADGTEHVNNEENRNRVMTDTLKIVSSSLLGMSVGCAQCHDHRYDPISQEDYYRLRATFEPALNWRKWTKPSGRRVSLYTDADIAKAAEIEKQAAARTAEKNAKQKEYMAAALATELARHDAAVRAPLEAAYRATGKDRTAEQKALLARYPSVASLHPGVLYQYNQKRADELKKIDGEIAAIRAKKPTHEFVRALAETNPDPVNAQFFYRGDYRQPQHDVAPGGLTIASPAAPFTIPANDETKPSTGRRLAYAKWLTGGKHPMLARVLINRFWLNHFGKTFVSTPDEFGKLGSLPTHPELLDWLAAEFMENGWSLKHLHRLIMTSTVYMQQSTRTAEANSIDGSNSLYWHFPVHRLDAEAMRDSILAISDRLDTTQFGPPATIITDDTGQIVVQGDKQRRSVYLQVRRTEPVAMLTSFDAPVMEVNCAKRDSSTVATQSLMLMNSDFILQSSKAFAARINQQAARQVDTKLTHGITINVASIASKYGSPWDYGYGFVTQAKDGAKVSPVKFTRFPFFGSSTWKGGEKIPDEKLGFSNLTAAGGHPETATKRPIRRWTSPVAGTIRVDGQLSRRAKNSDGVHLTVYSSRLGQVAECTVPNGSKNYSATLQVAPGDLIDTIVDERTTHTSDSFANTFVIHLLDDNYQSTQSWNSQTGFSGPLDSASLQATLPQQIAYAWQLAYGRWPQRDDVELASEFVREQLRLLYEKQNRSPVLQAMTNYCQSLLISNQFLYVE